MDRNKALDILGFSLNDNPDKEKIKKAFKKKAAKLHPDVNKSDTAEEQFKNLNTAQDFLLNPQKQRQNYNTRQQGSVDWHVQFSDFFKTSGAGGVHRSGGVHARLQPIRANVNVSFVESVLGCVKKIKINKKSSCKSCVCSVCSGDGFTTQASTYGGIIFNHSITCSACGGKGKSSENCKKCNNSGFVENVSEYSVNIPGGVNNGTTLRLRGFGNSESYNGILYTGDVILTVYVERDKDMYIKGNDVISNIDITLLEALKGVKKKVKTVLGEVTIVVKKNAKNKDMVTLKKYGVAKRGNHIFNINVLYPKSTDKLIEFLKEN